ncbi:MAG TPA: hypothetical protein VGF67_06605 [Ktedonobacteraceae bacterium]
MDLLTYPMSVHQAHPGAGGQVSRRIPLPTPGSKPGCAPGVLHCGVSYLNGMDTRPAPSPLASSTCAAVDLRSARLLWLAAGGLRLAATSAAAAHGLVYVQVIDPASRRQSLLHLLALDARSGIPLWQVSARATALNGPPTIPQEFVYLSYEGWPTGDADERLQIDGRCGRPGRTRGSLSPRARWWPTGYSLWSGNASDPPAGGLCLHLAGPGSAHRAGGLTLCRPGTFCASGG